MPKESRGRVSATVRIDPELWHRVRMEAAERQCAAADIVEEALREREERRNVGGADRRRRKDAG